MLDVPRDLLLYVSRLLHQERERRGTRRRTRLPTCFRQAVYVIAWFRDNPDVERLGAGFGLSRATAYRYRDEGIAVLSAQTPDLHEALERAKQEGLSHLVLDGKVVDTDRVTEPKLSRKGKEIDAWYAGKTHDFGGLIQALMNPRGIPLWVSEVMPGSVHDITAARELVLAILAAYAGDLPVLADGGYEGAGHGVLVPVKTPKGGGELDPDTRAYNKLLRALRYLGERGFALLVTRWKILQHVTISPRRITDLARAALVLTIRAQDDHAIVAEITSANRRFPCTAECLVHADAPRACRMTDHRRSPTASMDSAGTAPNRPSHRCRMA